MTDTTRLAALLREQGWEPEWNVCKGCGHDGGDHDLSNWCLICQPPRSDYFASFSQPELWERAVSRLIAAGVTLDPRPAPTDRLMEAVRRVIADGIDSPGVHNELHAAFYEARDARPAPKVALPPSDPSLLSGAKKPRPETQPCTQGKNGGTCDGTDHVQHLVYSCFTGEELRQLRDRPAPDTALREDGPDLVFSTSPAPEGIDTDCMFLASPGRMGVHISRRAINAQVRRAGDRP